MCYNSWQGVLVAIKRSKLWCLKIRKKDCLCGLVECFGGFYSGLRKWSSWPNMSSKLVKLHRKGKKAKSWGFCFISDVFSYPH